MINNQMVIIRIEILSQEFNQLSVFVLLILLLRASFFFLQRFTFIVSQLISLFSSFILRSFPSTKDSSYEARTYKTFIFDAALFQDYCKGILREERLFYLVKSSASLMALSCLFYCLSFWFSSTRRWYCLSCCVLEASQYSTILITSCLILQGNRCAMLRARHPLKLGLAIKGLRVNYSSYSGVDSSCMEIVLTESAKVDCSNAFSFSGLNVIDFNIKITIIYNPTNLPDSFQIHIQCLGWIRNCKFQLLILQNLINKLKMKEANNQKQKTMDFCKTPRFNSKNSHHLLQFNSPQRGAKNPAKSNNSRFTQNVKPFKPLSGKIKSLKTMVDTEDFRNKNANQYNDQCDEDISSKTTHLNDCCSVSSSTETRAILSRFDCTQKGHPSKKDRKLSEDVQSAVHNYQHLREEHILEGRLMGFALNDKQFHRLNKIYQVEETELIIRVLTAQRQ